MNEQLKTRLQRYRDLQEKKHRKFLETKVLAEEKMRRAEKYHQDSIRLMTKVVQTQELLMAR